MSKKVIVAIGGASGAVYANILLQKLATLKPQWEKVGVIMSENAKINWELEIGSEINFPDIFDIYKSNDFFAPFASGSAKYDTMIVCPCSMGVLGRINAGVSNDLTTRAADVILKERRKLILAVRESPLSLIHLRNMVSVTEAGAIVCPAIPSFYSDPKNIQELSTTVVDRILDLAGFELESFRWGESS